MVAVCFVLNRIDFPVFKFDGSVLKGIFDEVARVQIVFHGRVVLIDCFHVGECLFQFLSFAFVEHSHGVSGGQSLFCIDFFFQESLDVVRVVDFFLESVGSVCDVLEAVGFIDVCVVSPVG